MPILLFLDFDGVTHPLHATDHSPYDARPRDLARILADGRWFRSSNVSPVNRVARALDARIVVASAWRLDFGWEPFGRLFERRVVGQTPWIDMFETGREHLRYREVLRYLAEHRLAGVPWLAIDDNRKLYPAHAPAYITDGAFGLTEADADALIARHGAIAG